MKVVFTCQSYPAAAREWSAGLGFACVPLGADIGLADIGKADFAQVSSAALSAPLVFTRHMFPAQFTVPAGEPVISLVEEIAALLDPARSYSVQARSVHGNAPTRPLSEALQQRGFQLDIRHPEQVVSIYVALDTAYVGVSEAVMNLSDWNGGMMHFSEKGLISRAECKLLEAINVFSLPVRQGIRALDLGAAPGGWSNALAQRGAIVTAVDPAELDERVLPLVSHAKVTAQEFFTGDTGTYDLIVNDMKMDAFQALYLLFPLKDRLAPGGSIVSTLKLPKKNGAEVAAKCLRLIRANATLLGARQLFHNRSEITVYFR